MGAGLDHEVAFDGLSPLADRRSASRRNGWPILDRLLHHCEVVSINGNSYRLRNKLFAIDGGDAATA
jgi:hypothetical protein